MHFFGSACSGSEYLSVILKIFRGFLDSSSSAGPNFLSGIPKLTSRDIKQSSLPMKVSLIFEVRKPVNWKQRLLLPPISILSLFGLLPGSYITALPTYQVVPGQTFLSTYSLVSPQRFGFLQHHQSYSRIELSFSRHGA